MYHRIKGRAEVRVTRMNRNSTYSGERPVFVLYCGDMPITNGFIWLTHPRSQLVAELKTETEAEVTEEQGFQACLPCCAHLMLPAVGWAHHINP